LYESRDPPKKRRDGRVAWLVAHGACVKPPSTHRDHGPDGPDGPAGVEDLSLRRRARPEFRGAGLPHSRRAPAPRAGTIEGDGPDAGDAGRGGVARGDLRLFKPWFACLAGSTGCGPRPRGTSRSYVAALAVVVVALWLRPWFQPDPRRRSSNWFAGAQCDTGNNCWR
jgi:hypothetical protein